LRSKNISYNQNQISTPKTHTVNHKQQDIRDLLIQNESSFKDASSDYKINYAKPEKSDYRVKRNQVYIENHNEPSISKDLKSEYRTTYPKYKQINY
jgi:hypothetical protein